MPDHLLIGFQRRHSLRQAVALLSPGTLETSADPIPKKGMAVSIRLLTVPLKFVVLASEEADTSTRPHERADPHAARFGSEDGRAKDLRIPNAATLSN